MKSLTTLRTASLLLLYLCSLAKTIEGTLANQDPELVSILSNPKYRHNSLGNVIPGRFIIEFDENYHGSSEDFVSDFQADMNPMISSRIKLDIAQDFDVSPTIFRGVSVALYDNYISPFNKRDTKSPRSIENTVLKKLLQENRVKHVYPVVEIPSPRVKTVMTYDTNATDSERHSYPKLDIPNDGPPLPFTHSMTQVDEVHTKLGLKGKGILVGVIDSGVDYHHPALGNGFGEGHLVRYGYDLVGNDYVPRDPSSRKTHDTPLDNCEDGTGHGTHVAGIIAANDKLFNFTGVAPEVTLGAWRVFSCAGSTSNDILIQALLDAHKAGCDIINLSLGSPSNWPHDPISLIANRIARQGVLVVAAAGNDGGEGAFYISTPSTGSKTVSVASVDNIYNLQQTILSEAGAHYPYALSSSTTKFPSGKLVNYVNSTSTFDACNGTTPDNDLSGKLVLVQRGNCTFDEKADTVRKYGAKGLVVYNNIKEAAFRPQILKKGLPVSAISLEAGIELKALFNSGNYTDGIQLDFQDTLTRLNVSTQYEVSDFSSVGPLYDMSLKPDVAGPGGYIFSTLPINNGGYGMLSGTSMAAPYISGAYALYLEKYGKKYGVDYMREHFQNYAKPTHLLQTYLDNPIRQGAGLLQLLDAISQTTHVSPGSFSFNDTENMKQQTLKITNPSSDTIKYKVQNLQSITGAPYDISSQGFAPLSPLHYTPDAAVANLSFSRNEITLSPGEAVEITIDVVSISQHNEDYPYPIYGGFIEFLPDNSTLKPIHVPYIGVQGSLSQLPIFDEKFPLLLSINTTKIFTKEIAGNVTTGLVLDRSDKKSDFITSVFRLLTGTNRLITEVLNYNLTSVGIYSDYRDIARSLSTESGYLFTEIWNGTILSKEVGEFVELDPGYYYLNWKALKLLSDPNLPESWETKLSSPILITNKNTDDIYV